MPCIVRELPDSTDFEPLIEIRQCHLDVKLAAAIPIPIPGDAPRSGSDRQDPSHACGCAAANETIEVDTSSPGSARRMRHRELRVVSYIWRDSSGGGTCCDVLYRSGSRFDEGFDDTKLEPRTLD